MSTQRIPSASAVVPSTQAFSPEISVSDKTAQWHDSYERFNDHCFYKAELEYIFDKETYGCPKGERDAIMGIYEELLPLGGYDHIFEMFVKAVWNWSL